MEEGMVIQPVYFWTWRKKSVIKILLQISRDRIYQFSYENGIVPQETKNQLHPQN